MRQKFSRLTTLLPVILIMTALMCLDTLHARAATTTVYVTLTVGETATITDESGNYASTYNASALDTDIATVGVTGETTLASTDQATSAASGSEYYVGNGTNYLVLNGSTISTTTDITQATLFTWTESSTSGPGGTTRYLSSGSYYLRYNNGWSATTSTGNNNGATSFSSYSGNLSYTDGFGIQSSTVNTGYSLYTMTEASNSTTITFTGVAEGTTTVTVGDTTYVITVAAEETSTSDDNPIVAGTGVGAGKAVTKLTISKTLSFDLDLSLDSSTYTSVSWSSADTDIAIVDANGTVTGVAAGETTVTATVTLTDGTEVSYSIPVVVRDDGVSYSSTLKIYDFYVSEMTHTTAYYGVLYGTTNNNVAAYELVELQEGEAVYIAFESTAGTAVDFFAKPDSGYAVTYMASTNSDGHYLALDSEDPASTTFITTSGAAGANQVTDFGSTVVYELVQKALDKDCDSAMGWTRGSGSTGGATSLISFRSQPLPDVEKEITSVNGSAYTDGMSIEVGDVITYTVTVTQYATDGDSITYSNEVLTEGLDGAVFTDTNSSTTTPTLTSGVLAYDIAKTYTVTYTVTTDDLGKNLINTVSLSFTYKTAFSTGSYSDAAEATCSVAIVDFYPTGLVMDYGLPLVIDYSSHHGTNDLKDGDVSCDYGTITVASNVVTFIPNTVITEAFSVTLTDVNDITYTFKIYPATTVYYEEGFASYGTGWDVDTTSPDKYWSTYSNKGALASAQQAHTAIDTSTNGIYYNYGYDVAYADDTQGSEGTAAATTTVGASLSFTFTGTGVDIFANCKSDSDMVAIRVADSTGAICKFLFVATANTGDYAVSGTAYNTPIASVSGLTYGSYTVTIYLVTATGSGFQFDGFRVYDTIAQSEDASTDAYAVQTTVYQTDDEDYPVYYELRNYVLAGLNVADYTSTSDYAADLSNSLAQVYASSETGTGAIVTYSSGSGILTGSTTVQDLLDDGPKNELYLYAGGSVVFKITTDRTVQVGMRSVTGTEVSYSITVAKETNTITTATTNSSLSSSVDMFYDLVSKDSTEYTYTITITNTGSGVLSITDIKVSDSSSGDIFEELTAENLVAAITGETEEGASSEGVNAETEAETAGNADAETEAETTGSAEAEAEGENTGSTETEAEEETTGSAGSETKTEGTQTRAASLEVNLTDYTGSVIAATSVAKNGVEGEATTFAASDILAAVNAILPEGYALVDPDGITDQAAVYGESSCLNLQIGKTATLTVTCVMYSGLSRASTVATVTLTKVQTGPGKTAVFTASEIRAAIPQEYQVLLVTSASVNYGSGGSKVVTVY